MEAFGSGVRDGPVEYVCVLNVRLKCCKYGSVLLPVETKSVPHLRRRAFRGHVGKSIICKDKGAIMLRPRGIVTL